MIQSIHYRIGGVTTPDAVGTLLDSVDKLAKIYPALRGAHIEQHDTNIDITLRCGGRDRWKISSTARLILSSLLRRIKTPVDQAQHVATVTEPSARNLTREQGRNVTPRGRGARHATDRRRQRDAATPDPNP